MELHKHEQRHTAIRLIAILLVLAPASLPAQQANPSAWDLAISVCRDIQDPDARVACYDSLAERMNSAGNSTAPGGGYSPAQQDNRVMTPEERQARLRQQQMAAQGRRPEETAPAALDAEVEFSVPIVDLQKRPNGWRISLANGQVWQQMINKRYNLEEGMIVHIYPTIWGKSHRLTVDRLGSFIQVERIK